MSSPNILPYQTTSQTNLEDRWNTYCIRRDLILTVTAIATAAIGALIITEILAGGWVAGSTVIGAGAILFIASIIDLAKRYESRNAVVEIEMQEMSSSVVNHADNEESEIVALNHSSSRVDNVNDEREREVQGTPFWTKAEIKAQTRRSYRRRLSQRVADPLDRIRVMAQSGVVAFYQEYKNRDTAFLGNFYPCPITYNGITYRCAEAAFQAQKFSHQQIENQFVQFDGEEAHKYGETNSESIREDWIEVRVQIMRQILEAKFEQNPDLMERLQITGDAYLVQHTVWDDFWGDSPNGNGENKLGQLLMQIRGNIASPSTDWIDFAQQQCPY